MAPELLDENSFSEASDVYSFAIVMWEIWSRQVPWSGLLPMQIIKVWDVATGECVATLEGHSERVRCGVHCTFVMMCLRCRSMALRSLRTGGASSLARRTTRSRCGTWRPASAWRRWKGTRITCVAASTVLLC